jgi:hypothetical protein
MDKFLLLIERLLSKLNIWIYQKRIRRYVRRSKRGDKDL